MAFWRGVQLFLAALTAHVVAALSETSEDSSAAFALHEDSCWSHNCSIQLLQRSARVQADESVKDSEAEGEEEKEARWGMSQMAGGPERTFTLHVQNEMNEPVTYNRPPRMLHGNTDMQYQGDTLYPGEGELWKMQCHSTLCKIGGYIEFQELYSRRTHSCAFYVRSSMSMSPCSALELECKYNTHGQKAYDGMCSKGSEADWVNGDPKASAKIRLWPH